MKISGVYKITSPSGKFYVGSAADIAQRWRVHRCRLGNDNHDNAKLQNAWRKYQGELTFSVLVECAAEDVLANEQRLIDELCPAYNILRVAGSSVGYRHTAETKAKFKQDRVGKKYGPRTEDHKRKLSEANKGKHSFKHSPEALAKIAAAGKGRQWTEESRAKVAASVAKSWEARREAATA